MQSANRQRTLGRELQLQPLLHLSPPSAPFQRQRRPPIRPFTTRQHSNHSHYVVQVRRAASIIAASSSAPPPPPSIDVFETEVSYSFSVENVCELVVAADLDGTSSAAVGALTALYHFYLSRSKRLSAAVVDLLEKNPELKTALDNSSSNNSIGGMKRDVATRLTSNPEQGASILDSLQDLLLLCQTAAPTVASSIQIEIKKEFKKERKKAQLKRSSSGDKTTDLPSSVLAAASVQKEEDLAQSEEASLYQASSSAGEAPISLATKVTRSPIWESWKYRLRSALIDSHHGQPPPPPRSTYACRYSIDARTADESKLLASLRVVASGPGLGSVATKGPDGDDNPLLKSFFLFELLLEQPEANMLQALGSASWKAAHLPVPDTFACTFFSKQDKGAEKEKEQKEKQEEDEDEFSSFTFEGTGNELKVLLMVLAVLEGGELPGGKKSATNVWTPANQNIQWRQRRDGGGYDLRVGVEREGDGEVVEIVEHVVDTRHVRALIDCLDTFCELHPSFALTAPKFEVPPASFLQQLSARVRSVV